MMLIKIIAKVFMSKLLTLIYNPEVLVLMTLKNISNLTLNNKIQIESGESFFIDDIHRWMILGFKKWVYPSDKIMMLIIVEILLQELDLEKLFQKHLMSQFNAGTIWNLDHNIAIILCVLFVIELEMTF
jgi:hypothetical protein